MDGDDGGVECYHLDHSSGRLYTAEVLPSLMVSVNVLLMMKLSKTLGAFGTRDIRNHSVHARAPG
eukprot:4511984-Amphidinium_carterae.1